MRVRRRRDGQIRRPAPWGVGYLAGPRASSRYASAGTGRIGCGGCADLVIRRGCEFGCASSGELVPHGPRRAELEAPVGDAPSAHGPRGGSAELAVRGPRGRRFHPVPSRADCAPRRPRAPHRRPPARAARSAPRAASGPRAHVHAHATAPAPTPRGRAFVTAPDRSPCPRPVFAPSLPNDHQRARATTTATTTTTKRSRPTRGTDERSRRARRTSYTDDALRQTAATCRSHSWHRRPSARRQVRTPLCGPALVRWPPHATAMASPPPAQCRALLEFT